MMGTSHEVTRHGGQAASRRHRGAGFVPARASHASRRAFTLIEIVVVISIVLVLVGLTLSVSTVVIERSEIRQTENTMRLLDMALGEWEALADRQITWGPGAAYDMAGIWVPPGYSTTKDIFIISELLDTIARPSQVKDMIARIDPEFVHQYEDGVYPPWVKPEDQGQQDSKWVGSLAILDAWNAPVYPIHPGPLWEDMGGTPLIRDEDGTARIFNELQYGISRNQRICFVSAGPDGRFGTLLEFGGDSEAKQKARADNIYSYQPLAPPGWSSP